VSLTPYDIRDAWRLLRGRIQNALINRPLLQQLLLKFRVGDDALLNEELTSASVIARVETMSSYSDTGLALSSSAIATPIC
jgi:hypothetical protein